MLYNGVMNVLKVKNLFKIKKIIKPMTEKLDK